MRLGSSSPGKMGQRDGVLLEWRDHCRASFAIAFRPRSCETCGRGSKKQQAHDIRCGCKQPLQQLTKIETEITVTRSPLPSRALTKINNNSSPSYSFSGHQSIPVLTYLSSPPTRHRESNKTATITTNTNTATITPPPPPPTPSSSSPPLSPSLINTRGHHPFIK